MPRYALTPLVTNTQEVAVAVGWDPPLQTFFLTVRRPDHVDVGGDDRVLLWLGDDWRREPEPERVLASARLWAEIPEDLVSRLLADRDGGGTRTRPEAVSALQWWRS